MISKKFLQCFALWTATFLILSAVSCNQTADTPENNSSPIENSLSENDSTDRQIEKTAEEDLIVILHAGGAENDMSYMNAQETFLGYYNQGYRYFEYDLKLSKDGRLIGTHNGEHLENCDFDNISYAEFTALRLSNGYTPVNEEWLMHTIMQYPDVKIVVDAKMPDTQSDAAVLARFEELESIYQYDLSANIIPEVFSLEMWELLQNTTTFDKYFFSHYKVYYTVDMMLEYFEDERIWGIALPLYTDGDIRSQLYKIQQAGKKIFVFTAYSQTDIQDVIDMGANGVYVDYPNIISNKDSP